MKRVALIFVGFTLLALGFGTGGFLYFNKNKSNIIIPVSIKQDARYGIYFPTNKKISINKSNIQYDSKVRLLTYEVQNFNEKASITVSQQPTPSSLNNIKGLEDLVRVMGKYATIDSPIGKVYLTKAVSSDTNKEKQTAVFSSKDTLLFAKPDTLLSENDWVDFFSSFNLAN